MHSRVVYFIKLDVQIRPVFADLVTFSRSLIEKLWSNSHCDLVSHIMLCQDFHSSNHHSLVWYIGIEFCDVTDTDTYGLQ